MEPPPPPPATAPTQSSTATAPSASSSPATLPHLTLLPPSEPHTFVPPTKCINTGTDLPHFFASQAYHDICTFILQLNRALCPRKTTVSTTSCDNTNTRRAGATKEPVKTFPLTSPRHDPPSVIKLRDLLNKVEEIINEVPPEAGPRRFGNAAFRRWHGVLDGRVEGLIREYLAETQTGWDVESEGLLAELKAYFMGGFGSAQRLDYGTGHELSFLAFLGGLWKLGVFAEEDQDGEVERSVVLGVFEPYLKVVRRLILTYNLEPAGTHGVWGLDDHSFLPYIFGSAQLTRPIADGEPMPKEGSVLGAPKPAAVAKADSVALYRDANMYFSAVGFINDVKRGPFWEHSPMLFDISGIKDGWGKVNKGMIKMFNAEVLGKFPVVQHFPFGSLFSWDLDPNADSVLQSAHLASHDVAGTGAVPGTAAPWAQSAGGMPGAGVPSGPGIPYSRAPWAQTGSAGPALPRGGTPDTGPPPPTSFPRGMPGQASNQISVTKAPWAK